MGLGARSRRVFSRVAAQPMARGRRIMNLMRRWAGLLRSGLFLRLLACLMIGAVIAPMAEAGAKRKPKVLFLHSDVASAVNDVRNKLAATGLFQTVDTWDGHLSTPTLAQLNGYDAVMVSNFDAWADRATLGTNLAQYVDGGGGVVQTVFTTAGILNSNLGGSWTATYNCITFGSSTYNSSASLGPIAVQNHPIMIGVQSFDGGSLSVRPSGTALTAGATLVASWTDGKPLVAVGPKINRCDLGMYPPSSDNTPGYWVASTDGVKLMANALLYVMRPRVMIAGAPSTATWNDDVKAKLAATGTLGIIDIFNTNTGTPALAQLQAYDAVLVYSDLGFQNQAALGNVLADYVDAGGGVVSAVFATSAGFGTSRLTGRWAGTYELIFGNSGQTSGAATLGAVTYPAHPAMSGVASFNGGTSSYRETTAALNPGAFNIAQWNDSRPLVVASTKFANRVDLGFFPPSSTVRSDFWVVGTNGDKIMANALLYTVKPYVACVNADSTYSPDPVAKLLASRRFSGVANVDAQFSTPAAATLKPFNAIMSWSNFAYNNSTTLGDNLADFVDAGGGVVSTMFNNVFLFDSNYTLAGRWPTQGYDIVPTASLPGYSFGPQTFLGSIVEPSNPLATFVRKFDGGANSYHATSAPLLRGRTIIKWSDGKMLASVHNFKKRADLGFWPGSDGTLASAWNQRTDGTWMMANALEFVVRAKPCPGDFNGDGQVDDLDFVLFAGYYDNLVDPRGDLNGDGLTEDSDFVIFAADYDILVCP